MQTKGGSFTGDDKEFLRFVVGSATVSATAYIPPSSTLSHVVSPIMQIHEPALIGCKGFRAWHILTPPTDGIKHSGNMSSMVIRSESMLNNYLPLLAADDLCVVSSS